jgi:eukaryotic-like serine/threonine-protein kinase
VKTEDADASTLPLGTDARVTLAPGTVLLDRFVVEACLGRGGMGEVFAATDRANGTRVALKTLVARTPESIALLKREFRAAAEIVHPNLVQLKGLFCDDEDRFFTMELLQGIDLAEHLRGLGNDPDRDALRAVLRQLALGLDALHAAGTLHGDLKPSNCLVEHGSHRVVLLDFGLSRSVGPDQPLELAGTPAYMSPEQLLGQPLTEAADWYSLGIVLHEALTGKVPRPGTTPQHLPGVPEDLGRLCFALLSLDPAARPRGPEVLRWLGARSELPRVSSPPVRPSLVGRQAELERLERALDAAAAGRPTLAIVSGASGIGKTALVEQFLDRAAGRAPTLLAGRCREQESLRYKAVDGIVDDVVDLLAGLPEEALRALLPPSAADLAVVFPALLALPAVAARTAVPRGTDPALLRQDAIAAFQALIERLGSRGPVILWIDDLQWSDAESALFLAPLFEAPRLPLLMIASHRDGQPGATLEEILRPGEVAPVAVPVGPLATADAETLAVAHLTPAPPDRARAIARESGGHPLFIVELALAAAEDAPGDDAPPSLSMLVRRRVARLPAPARRVLDAAAVAGAPLPRTVLLETTGLGPAEADLALSHLRARRLTRSGRRETHDWVDLHHDRIRVIVAESLDAAERQRLHATLARTLEGVPGIDPEVLAAHLEAAGDHQRAGLLWLAGADAARSALAFAHAAALYARGARLAHLEGPELHAIELRRAEALALAGRGPEAAELLLARAVTCGPSEALELTRRAGEQLLQTGHVERGLRLLEQVLGSTRPRDGTWTLPAIVAGRVRLRVRGLRYQERPEGALDARDRTRIDALWAIASALGVLDPIRAIRFQNQHLSLALSAGEPHRLLRALVLEVPYAAASSTTSRRRIDRLLAMSDELAQHRDDAQAHGLVLLCRGLDHYLHGRLEPAVTYFEATSGVLAERHSGQVWEAVTAQRFTVASLFFLGRFRRIAELVPAWLKTWEGTGNVYATMTLRSGYALPAWLAADDVPLTEAHLAKSREEWRTIGFAAGHWLQLIGETSLDLYVGEPERAYARILELWPRIVAAHALRIGVLRLQLWQLRAVCALAAARACGARGAPDRAQALRADARQCLGRFARVRMARAAPLAALVRAALEEADDHAEAARRHLREAADGFEQQQLGLYCAAARLHLAARTRGRAAADLERLALAAFEREGVASPARTARWLAPGF